MVGDPGNDDTRRSTRLGRSRLRECLALVVSLHMLVAVPVLLLVSWPQEAAADDDDDDDDDDFGGDDFGGDDEFEDDDDDDEDEYRQPAHTAGGLYTKATWPTAALMRNLTLIGGMVEFRGGIDIDVSNRRAFEIWRAVAEAKWGVLDNFELQGGVTTVLSGDISGFDQNARFFFGFENSIVFDIVDFRLLTELEYLATDPAEVNFNFVVGLPFRIRIKEKVGVFAFDRLLTIRTDGDKPDITAGFGLLIQPIDLLAVILRAEVQVPRANFDDNITVPATASVQVSPSNAVDLGIQFTFANLTPQDENVQPHDQRRLLLYGQFRL